MEQLKASRTELNQAMHVIQNLHKKLAHVSMVQVEISRALVPNNNSSSIIAIETAQQKQATREYLLKQCKIVHNWILDFPMELVHKEFDGEGEVDKV